ncbi:MAG: type II secretion system protein [Sulfurovum sp.]|nr:MAG: type II secretion system protein [Sulfurovum sp.]
MKTILRPALTMIELILVIVILGIVASIGAEIIANVYEGYIIQRAQHRASIKTELAATQIANRLAYAIPGTVVRKAGLTQVGQNINEVSAINYNILQWVGTDADSFKAISAPGAGAGAAALQRHPGWSGFCDVANSANLTLSTPGSNLGLASTIIANLGGNINNAEVYFPLYKRLTNYGTPAAPVMLPLVNYGVNAAGPGAETITLDSPLNNFSEHYKLAWTSYALEAKNNGDLVLHYSFTPQRDAAINDNPQILLRNVTTFRFRGDGRTIRFKICVRENIGDGNITLCKEKAVF